MLLAWEQVSNGQCCSLLLLSFSITPCISYRNRNQLIIIIKSKVRKKLSVEHDIGMLPGAQTLNMVVFFHQGIFWAWRRVPETLGFCVCSAPRAGRVWLQKNFGLDQEAAFEGTLSIRLSWFSECTSWIPFRWNSHQKMHSRSAFNVLGLLLAVEPMGAKQS